MSDFTDKFEPYDFPLLGYIKMPKIKADEKQAKLLGLNSDASPAEYLKALIRVGLEEKIKGGKIPNDKLQTYKDRANEEYKTICNLDFTSYILLVYEILRFCRENDIPNSPARGSVGGSLVCWLLKIISIDPIKYNLLFSRFISESRTEKKIVDGELYLKSESLPDIDIDSSNAGKPLVKQKIESMYPGKTVAISNISTLSSKILIKEVLKSVWESNETDAQKASELIDKSYGRVHSIADSLKGNKSFKKWAEKKDEIIEVCLSLQNLYKNKSTHAAGVLLCDKLVLDTVPIEFDKSDSAVCSYDMEGAQMAGIKLDNLAVLTLDICHDCLKAVGKTMEDIDIEDASIYNFLRENDKFYGLFQISEGLGRDTIKKIQPTGIEDIIASIALGRPGCMPLIDDYVNKTIDLTKMDSRVVPILEASRGVIIYQESVMKLAMVMADFDGGGANSLRRGIGKKDRAIVLKFKDQFISNSIKNNFDPVFVNWCWDTFERSADYSFNRCLSPDTLVETPYGHKMMSEIVPGDLIKAFDLKTKTDHYVKVEKIFNNNRELYRVEFEDGKVIKPSLDHKFLCSDFSMRQLGRVIEHDFEVIAESGRTIRIHTVVKLGIQKTLDFKVDHKDHNFYANGIVVSNSHATGYAALTGISCFLKSNYPQQFFLSCLKHIENNAAPIEEVSKIQTELQYFGIKLLPPHIIKSQLDFTLEGPNIRMGLKNIKGVSDKSIEKLNKFKHQHSNKFEIFQAANETKIPISILSSLILVGALDDELNRKRSYVVLEAQLWNLLTAKEKALCHTHGPNFQFDLIKTFKHIHQNVRDEKGRPEVKDSRFETIKKSYNPCVEVFNRNKQKEKLLTYINENALLGYSYSVRLRDLFPGVTDLSSIYEVNSSLVDEFVHFVGRVSEIKEGVAKNEKKTKYLKCLVRDETASTNVLLFNDSIQEHKEDNGEKIKDDDIVIVRGRKKEDCVFAFKIGIQEVELITKKDLTK